MKTKTLKTFYNENNFKYNQFNFMALDIQGAELMALEGGDEIINFVDYIYIEVNTKELYENGAKLEEIEKYLHKFNFVRKTIYMTEHGWGDAFYVKNIFDISDNFTIEYGVDNIKNDITDVVFEKSFANNIIHIPNLDGIRGNLYGDPLFGIVKKIFINSGNNTFTIEHDVFVNIDIINHKLYINENISQKKYNYNFTIMAIFKNETMNLKLWLDHYLWQGIEHFYLIDNDSNDNPINILQE